MDDWRIEIGGEVVRGRTFRYRRYESPSAAWDHDHCELCVAKLTAPSQGYATPDLNIPGSLRWICEECWNDLHEQLDMRLEPQ
jgi:hypothetical protein